MTYEPRMLQANDSFVVERLVKETGVTLEDARVLVTLLGVSSWNSLLREAKLIMRSRLS